MNYDAAQFWFNAVLAVGGIIVTLYVWIMRRQMATQDDVARVATAVARLEESTRHHPTHEDLGRVYEKVNDLSKQVSGNGGVLKSMAREVGRISDYLLTKGKS